ncbi:MAG TPA: hypothetical protein PLF61_00525 [Candidatus Goldiibacteriota bacterium]|nr:hypothetical protein [Candidatus Goldiibacteriota bacterium]
MKSEQERAAGWRGEATQPRNSGEVAESPNRLVSEARKRDKKREVK